MIKYHDIEQRSNEWYALRIGRITGTSIKEVGGGKPATLENLCHKIAAEILTGISSEKHITITDAMQHGIDTEYEAIVTYELKTLNNVQPIGFVSRDDYWGVSPDGLVNDNGLVEIKCPQPNTHLSYLLKEQGTAWRAYRWQIQGQLWVTGRDWCDFVSYCPSFDEPHELLIERVLPDTNDMEVLDEKSVIVETRIKEILGHISCNR